MRRDGAGIEGILQEGGSPSFDSAVEHFGRRGAALVESSSDSMALLSPDGTLLYLNPACRGALGVQEPRPEETRLSDLLLAPSEAEILSEVRELGGWRGPCRFRKQRSGTPVGMEARFFALSRDGSAQEIALVARTPEALEADFGQTPTLHNQTNQTLKMEAVGRLAGGIAHDFNNLLTAISGFTEVLLDDLGLDPALRQGAEQTLRACHRSAAMIRQLQAVSRRQALEPVVTSASHRVGETMSLLHRLIGEDVVVETESSSDPDFVLADPAQLEQVLMNLVVNARDAMPAGGKLIVRTDRVDLDSEPRPPWELQPGPYVRITVEDTGHGMDPETLEHVFEPFFTTKDRGTGLGLATVYGIVKQSGGHVAVESRPGAGTKFSVYLPAAKSAEEPPEAKPVAGAVRGGETVLVVEDENVVRFVVREGLTRAGYRVLEARSGDEALGIVADHEGDIHLLLSDVVMPGMDGPTLAERVACRHPRVKTIYMSGHDEDSVRRHGITSGEVHYLEKPFTRGSLALKVREVLDS